MNDIKMVDLGGQYQEFKENLTASFEDILENSSFINGPAVHAFQKELEEYLDVKHVIPCANGTDALQVALMGLGLERGDEVITSDFTFAATVEVISLLGLVPVLVDVDPDLFTINLEEVEKAITSKTKAIIPVHLFGQCANMEGIMLIADKHNLKVIEDNAQAIGSDYSFNDGTTVKSGTIGHVGTTSFFPSKNLGCFGDGGAIFTNDDKLAHTLRGMVNHGMYTRYYHDVVGVNSRLDSLQAAVLREKLPRLNSYNEKRHAAAMYYSNGFSSSEKISTPKIADYSTHVFHQYTLKLNDVNRDELSEFLFSKNIPHAVYYPVPLHAQKAYKDVRYKEDNFKVTNGLVKCVLSLPMHTELDHEQQDFIINNVLDFINK